MLRVNENTAELVGIVLGDGNVYSKENNFELRVTLHKKEADYADFVKRLVEETFSAEASIRFRPDEQALDIRMQRRVPVEQSILLGLESGNKVEKRAGIPRWIFLREKFLKACIRGLIDTDGSMYFLKPQWPNLRQLSFKSSNPRLLEDVRKSLIRLGFRPSRIFGNRIVMTRQEEIARYFKEVGTSNSKYSPVV